MIFLFFTRWGEGGGEGGPCRYCEICLTGYATDNNQNEKYDAHATCLVYIFSRSRDQKLKNICYILYANHTF
jgi:hypothetical protein